jgi:hypothetical protein
MKIRQLRGGIDRPMPKVEGWFPAAAEHLRLQGKAPGETLPTVKGSAEAPRSELGHQATETNE